MTEFGGTEILIGILLIILLYSYIRENTSKDVNEVSLQYQSSIGSTRKVGESATYRSSIVGNVMNLKSGLEIRHGYRTRDGNISDIWKLGENNGAKVIIWDKDKPIEIDISKINGVVQEVYKRLIKIEPEVQTVAIWLPNCKEFFITVMACIVNGITVHLLNSTESRTLADITADIIVIPNFLKVEAKGKTVITVGERDAGETDLEGLSWEKEIGKYIEQVENCKFDYDYDAKYDKGAVFSVCDDNKENMRYSVRNIAAGVASVIKSLPEIYEISSKDRTLVVGSLSQLNVWIYIFAALTTGGTAVVVGEAAVSVGLLQQATVLYVPEQVLKRHVLALKQELGVLGTWRFQRSLAWLTNGIWPGGGVASGFGQVRLIFAGSRVGESGGHLSTYEMAELKVLTGARVVAQSEMAQVAGPVCQTSLYDYRVLGVHDATRRFGTAVPCLEMKLALSDGDDPRRGVLNVRGYSVAESVVMADAAREREGWVTTHVEGGFRDDGCFYA